jgi:hypothetical protein
MSARPKRKPTMRPETHKAAAVRCEQIREQIRAGVTRPRDIAAAIGCSLDLVRYYGRRMGDVFYTEGRNAGRRWHVELTLADDAQIAADRFLESITNAEAAA